MRQIVAKPGAIWAPVAGQLRQQRIESAPKTEVPESGFLI
jgi:hypothetical protein